MPESKDLNHELEYQKKSDDELRKPNIDKSSQESVSREKNESSIEPQNREKMDIPNPRRPGSEIIIGPEGPYSQGLASVFGDDSDAR